MFSSLHLQFCAPKRESKEGLGTFVRPSTCRRSSIDRRRTAQNDSRKQIFEPPCQRRKVPPPRPPPRRSRKWCRRVVPRAPTATRNPRGQSTPLWRPPRSRRTRRWPRSSRPWSTVPRQSRLTLHMRGLTTTGESSGTLLTTSGTRQRATATTIPPKRLRRARSWRKPSRVTRKTSTWPWQLQRKHKLVGLLFHPTRAQGIYIHLPGTCRNTRGSSPSLKPLIMAKLSAKPGTPTFLSLPAGCTTTQVGHSWPRRKCRVGNLLVLLVESSHGTFH